jgi:hypothetical protein
MKCSILVTCAVALAVGGHSTLGKETATSVKQLEFNLRIFVGDPLGSREAGTLKLLAEPRLVTLENRPFYFASGGETAVPSVEGVRRVHVGLRVEGKAGTIKSGRVQIDITLSNTTVKDLAKDKFQIQNESIQTITKVRLGETVKLRWASANCQHQAWAELSVEQIKQ